MPVVKTLHSPYGALRGGLHHAADRTVRQVVAAVTRELLQESPGLVADVAAGVLPQQVLEQSVLAVIDRQRVRGDALRDSLVPRVMETLFGYGPLEPLLQDPDISDIDGTHHDLFLVRRRGQRETVRGLFESEAALDTFVRLIAIRQGGILNSNDSHCRVSDEKRRLRINVSVRPRNITGPALSIRKHQSRTPTLEGLEEAGMLNREQAVQLAGIAESRASFLICGRGAAGKTTLLRAMVDALPEDERVLIAESDAEIYPEKPHCLVQRIKRPHEGGRPVTLRDLVRDGLTMTLDTYCIGEITGDEAWEFIRAGFSGHRVMATTHAEHAEDGLNRILSLAQGAHPGESETLLKNMLSRCIRYVVLVRDFRVTGILETGEAGVWSCCG